MQQIYLHIRSSQLSFLATQKFKLMSLNPQKKHTKNDKEQNYRVNVLLRKHAFSAVRHVVQASRKLGHIRKMFLHLILPAQAAFGSGGINRNKECKIMRSTRRYCHAPLAQEPLALTAAFLPPMARFERQSWEVDVRVSAPKRRVPRQVISCKWALRTKRGKPKNR